MEEHKTREYVNQEMGTEVISQTIEEEKAKLIRAEVGEYYKADAEEVRKEREQEHELENAFEAKMLETLQNQNRSQQTAQDSSSGQEGVSVIEDSDEEEIGEESEEVELDDTDREKLKTKYEWEDTHNDHAYRERNRKNLYSQYFTGYPSEEDLDPAPSPLYGEDSDKEKSTPPQSPQTINNEHGNEYIEE